MTMPKKSSPRTVAIAVRKLLAEHQWTDERRFLSKELLAEIAQLASTPPPAAPAAPTAPTSRRRSASLARNCRWERQPDGSLKWVCD